MDSLLDLIKKNVKLLDECNVPNGNFCPSCRDTAEMISHLALSIMDDHITEENLIIEANKENS